MSNTQTQGPSKHKATSTAHTASSTSPHFQPHSSRLLHWPHNCRLAPFAQSHRYPATDSPRARNPPGLVVSPQQEAPHEPHSQIPVPKPLPPALPWRSEQQHRLHLWETGTQRAKRESLYSGENIFVLRVKGSHFQQFNALFAGPGAGVAARGLFFEAEWHIMRLLTAAPCHPAKNQSSYLSINLTLHPLHFICLNKFGG